MTCYDEYPTLLVALNMVEALAAVAIGMMITAQFGLVAVLGYVGLASIAVAMAVASGCTRCAYYGRLCGAGLGRIAALVFKKGDEKEFGRVASQRVAWTLVGLVLVLPMVAGLVSVAQSLTVPRALMLAAFLGLMAAMLITHSRLVCPRCHEARERRCSLGRLRESL